MFQTSNQKNSWIWRISGIQPDHDWAPCGISRGSHDRINIHKGSWGSAMKKLHSESLGSDVFWDQWLEILAFSLQTMFHHLKGSDPTNTYTQICILYLAIIQFGDLPASLCLSLLMNLCHPSNLNL